MPYLRTPLYLKNRGFLVATNSFQSIVAKDIHIRIFDNRIEVESPGILPDHITTKNILNEQFSRNGNLVRIIHKFPKAPNKDIGEGLDTAFQSMKKLTLKPPVIEQYENSVLVIIPHEPLDSPAEIIMAYLAEEKGRSINNSKARRVCSITSERKMRTILKELVNKALIEPVPESKGSAFAYRKKS
ncbi:ATP-binding protein [Nodularia spumigena]|uniref:ATP-binding protein n=1 Tax=Nodularia spumigena TaxID=70799 RepID=UPI001379E5EE|nr:ATP-binding protein [Nodularia spumigena]